MSAVSIFGSNRSFKFILRRICGDNATVAMVFSHIQVKTVPDCSGRDGLSLKWKLIHNNLAANFNNPVR